MGISLGSQMTWKKNPHLLRPRASPAATNSQFDPIGGGTDRFRWAKPRNLVVPFAAAGA
jgi:hypothetical protein